MSDTVEISKADLALLQRAKGVLDSLYTDGKVGMDFKRMLKTKFPDTKIPELEMVENFRERVDNKLDPIVQENKKLKERLDKWETDSLNEKEEKALRSTLDDVQKKYGFTDDGMQKVIDRMKSKNNPDAESAAAFIKSQEPKAQTIKSSNFLPESMNLFGSSEKSEDASIAALHTDPRKWQDREIAKMLNEFEQEAA
jgi:hypothetical protein